jgi:predicted ester cyclase
MSAADNQRLVRRWIAFANAGFPGPFDEFITADYIGHAGGGEMDRDELERLERAFVVSFPGIQHTIDELLSVGDRTIMRATARGIHGGDFYGIAATGRQVEFTAIVIYRLDRGRIAESWGEIDFARLFRQLREP